MKSLVELVLLLMCSLPCQITGNDMYFNLGDLSQKIKKKSPESYVSDDVVRVAIVTIDDNNKYLLRFDPPEICGRVVICLEKDPTSKEDCEKKNEALYLNLNGEKAVREKKSTAFTKTEKIDEENILITRDAASSKVTFQFNTRSATPPVFSWDLTANDKAIRIETSSYYCKINIGFVTIEKTDELVPEMKLLNFGNMANDLDKSPFLLGKVATGTPRTYFGPLFNRYSVAFGQSSTCPREKEYEECSAFKECKIDKAQLCPHAHDLVGFARWTIPKNRNDQSRYDQSFWKNPIYRYHLKLEQNAPCGVLDSTTPKNFKPYQIDIEIANKPFDTALDVGSHRCFGFALVFGDENMNHDVDANGFKLDPKKTFEFYISSLMFIAPDSEKIRALRISRDALKKIRISLYKKNNKEYATVEYGFLNEFVAGVREQIELPTGFTSAVKSASLFSEGYCEVRLVKVLPAPDWNKKIGEPCMGIVGCDVLMRQ